MSGAHRGLKIANHVLIQAGRRLNLTITRDEVHLGFCRAVSAYRTPAGDAVGIYLQGVPCILVIRNGCEVVTLLTCEQASSTCPQGVFGFLLTTGRLHKALELRAKYHTKRLKMPTGGVPKIPAKLVTLWNAFKWVGEQESC